jgi:hypothetical protein
VTLIQGAAMMIKMEKRKNVDSGSRYYLHSKEYFTKTRESFINRLKETGSLSEDDLKMVEEVWGQVRKI